MYFFNVPNKERGAAMAYVTEEMWIINGEKTKDPGFVP
jgi:hypothetical protein